jgi:ParB family chromosome partitioning protein
MAATGTKIDIRHDHISPNPNNPRQDAGDVTDLARSIRSEGIIVPLLVIPDAQKGNGFFLLEAGFRRWIASAEFLEMVPCIVNVPKVGESLLERALITGLTENDQRTGLSAIERAHAYGRLRDDLGMSMTQIATRLGYTNATIGRYLSLLELAPASQKRVAKGDLSVEDAVEAVKRFRRDKRDKAGKKPIDVGWEPDHFTDRHHLAKKVQRMCDAREHTSRRRIRKIGCEQCWEDTIRQDQTTVLNSAYLDSQREGHNPVFLPPFQTADGAARGDTIANGI